ncbi:hypothetical protein Bca52824_024392 [Brassica carinata]|uniref:Uncharacterized protein n=1 Tax=Brassica carinata TaxID=52824 RepID=A0A8X8AUI9_BRACI|nr:hypothetical protein Bca52824_024392 [Brassica carinata]
MEEPKAAGRMVCSSSVAHWSEIVELLRNEYPSYQLENKRGNKEGDNSPHSMDTRKIRELGFASINSLPETFDDCIRSFQEKGLF